MASPPKKQLKLRENKPPGSKRLLLFPVSPILHHCRILKHLQSPSQTCPPLLFSCNLHSQFPALLDLLRALHFFSPSSFPYNSKLHRDSPSFLFFH